MSCSIDYLSMTFHGLSAEQVTFRLGRVFPYFEKTRGHHGYSECWRAPGCAVYHAGQDGMGVHVQVSGEGCALVSHCADFSSWGATFAEWLGWGAKYKRVDFAFDDRAGLLDLSVIKAAITEGRFASKWREWVMREKRNGAELREDCVYMGGAASTSSLCIYDKQVEQIGKGQDNPGPWVRCELRYKDGWAGAAAAWVIAHPELEGVAGLLAKALVFKTVAVDRNKHRIPTCEWWEAFLAEAGAFRLTIVKTLAPIGMRLARFLRQQGPTLFALDVIARKLGLVDNFVEDVLRCGSESLRGRHIEMMASYLSDCPGKQQVAVCT